MTCPTCGSQRVFPSRLRNALERLRVRLTDKEPHRCRECGWRGWRALALSAPHPDVQPDDLRTGRQAAPVSSVDLDPLDPDGQS
jgi:hypothetical protein